MLADLNNDGRKEIVLACRYMLYVKQLKRKAASGEETTESGVRTQESSDEHANGKRKHANRRPTDTNKLWEIAPIEIGFISRICLPSPITSLSMSSICANGGTAFLVCL